MKLQEKLNPNVVVLRLFPGIDLKSFESVLKVVLESCYVSCLCHSLSVVDDGQRPVRGIVLETFGSGNAPEIDTFLDVLRKVCMFVKC